MPFVPLSDWLNHIKRARAEVRPGMEKAVTELMAENLEISKAMIGREDNPGWAPLAPSTVARKQAQGYTGRISATDPDLASGELRDSLKMSVRPEYAGVKGEVGTDVEYAGFVEHGTSRQPPRPFLSPPFITMETRVVRALGKLAAKLLIPGYVE